MDKREADGLSLSAKILEAADYLRKAGVTEPDTGLILGSGLNDFADRLGDAVRIPYSEIPGFHVGKAGSHRSQLVYGRYMGKNLLILAGRFHYYECGDMDTAAFPARVLAELGIKRLIITNASGCVNENWTVGQLMLIKDHINLSGANPLIGPNLDKYGSRFPDMTYTYDRDLRAALIRKAEEKGISLVEGVYAMMSGPSFETPAEIRMIRVIGGDAVGMSSVPEAIIAAHAGIEVIGISLLANMAAGVLDRPLSGEEVTEAGKAAAPVFKEVVDLAITI